MNKTIAIFAPILLALAACASNVHVDYETQHNFAGYQTFELQQHSVTDPETYDAFGGDIFETRLYRAISDNLGTKGLEQSSAPDFFINYSLSKEVRHQVSHQSPNTFLRFWTYGPHHYYGYNDHYQVNDIRPYTVGRLTLKIIDARSNKTVWTSSSQTTLRKGKVLAEAEAALRERISKMLANFPPNNVLTL